MTREEALVQLRLGPGINEDVSEEYNEAVDMAIEVLEQQPNGDCISRKETIDALKQQAENMLCWSERYAEQRKSILTAINIVSDLPSVAPQPKTEEQQKTGHWFLSGGYWRCSECKEKALLKLDKATGGYREYEPVRSKYCPECGAKMQEVQQ